MNAKLGEFAQLLLAGKGVKQKACTKVQALIVGVLLYGSFAIVRILARRKSLPAFCELFKQEGKNLPLGFTRVEVEAFLRGVRAVRVGADGKNV